MCTLSILEQAVFTAAPDGVMLVDQFGRIMMANPAMEGISGYAAAALVAQDVAMFLPPHRRASRTQWIGRYCRSSTSRATGPMGLQLLRHDGRPLPVDVSLRRLDNGEAQLALVFVRDLTRRKKLEASLRHQAVHDELTGLPNRWLLRAQLGQALQRAERSQLRVAVIFLDLDYFKTVNDSYGHATGDALLVQAAERMRSVVRESDTLARMGGDEFAVLLPELAHPGEAMQVATQLLAALQMSYRLKEHTLYSGASLGLAFYPDDAHDGDTLLRYADLAMYQAKQAGRGNFACYSTDLDCKVHESMQLHTRLKEAIAHNLLALHYQPQVDVDSGLIVGVEALLRWQDPVLGQVSPTRFIPVAEATGLILPLSAWVLHTACAQIAAWAAEGTPLRVAINVSAQQFRQPNLPEQVGEALARSGAQAALLGIEITESVAMAQPDLARETISALVAMGCRVALDDFGTGYSSLAYLKLLPVSELKIDKTFMDGIPHEMGDVTISRAIIALAHKLGMALVAEGVENQAQLDFLRQNRCEMYQGWLFGKAMPAQEVSDILNALRRVPDLRLAA